VEWFDETCGQLLDYLDREGLAKDTLVLYVADNGWTQDPDQGRYVRSKQSPYDAGLRTPIMVRWPGRVRPRMAEEPVTSLDLAPTVLAAVGMERAPEMSGVDLRDEKAVRKRKAVQGACFLHTSVDLEDPAKNLRWRWRVEDGWKLIVPREAGEKSELYHLAEDPGEERDLAGREAGRVSALRRRLDAWWDPKR